MIGATQKSPWWFAPFVAVVALAALLLQPPAQASAHPLGNFTVSRYSRIELYQDVIRVHYVLDLAEIPSFQEWESVDTDGDGKVSDTESDNYAEAKGDELASEIRLTIDGEDAGLSTVARGMSILEGQAGLETIRLALVLEASGETAGAVEYRDNNYADRLGWKEIVVQSLTGLDIDGNVATEGISKALTKFPGGLLSSPLGTTRVAFSYDATDAPEAPVVDTASVDRVAESGRSRSGAGFAGLIDGENLTLAAVLLALLAAFGFGAVHALEPGHGKTMVAAYFVGVKGGARQALLLGMIIAVTHTVGVLAIGGVTLYASQWILPEHIYPWLSLASGLLILLLGLRLLASRGGLTFMHGILHRVLPHHHHHHEHDQSTNASGPPPWRSIVALGLADGLTPSPSALIVLLAAVSLDRLALGLGLIVSFSVGLAAVLAGVSLALVYAREITDWFSGRFGGGNGIAARVSGAVGGEAALVRLAPLGGACALVVVGTILTVRALAGTGIGIL